MEEKPNLSDLEANFIISSFKNKERRNNPSSIPHPLYPPEKADQVEEVSVDNVSADTDKVNISIESDLVNKANRVDPDPVTDNTCNTTKRTTSRQRKVVFEEYRMKTPKIVNRKPVFISESTRDRMNKIARKLGDDTMSASGFLENLVLHHLEMYEEDIELWRKL